MTTDKCTCVTDSYVLATCSFCIREARIRVESEIQLKKAVCPPHKFIFKRELFGPGVIFCEFCGQSPSISGDSSYHDC